jgi:hypothetical protein
VPVSLDSSRARWRTPSSRYCSFRCDHQLHASPSDWSLHCPPLELATLSYWDQRERNPIGAKAINVLCPWWFSRRCSGVHATVGSSHQTPACTVSPASGWHRSVMGQSEFKNEASPLPNRVSNTLNCGQQIPTTKLTRQANAVSGRTSLMHSPRSEKTA